MTSGFEKDDWLSEVMTRPVFKWAGVSAPTAGAIKKELSDRVSSRPGFFYVKWPTGDAAGLAVFTQAGFSVIDTPITLEWSGETPATPAVSAVVSAESSHYEALGRMAESCFRFSRFHLDPQIPERLAHLVKRRWLENYFNGKRGVALYVALVEKRVAGFLAVAEVKSLSERIAVIDLIGLAAEFQGRGIGANLVSHFVSEWRSRASSLRVGTQAANIPSLRLYEKTGFRIVGTQYVLHAHILPGAL